VEPCPFAHLRGCAGPLAAGTECVPEWNESPCMARGPKAPTFSCPGNNSDPHRQADFSGDLPEQLCHVCGINPTLVDEDTRTGWFSGVLNFGAVMLGAAIDETYVSEYRVYAVDENDTRLGEALAFVQKKNIPPTMDFCCNADVYSVRLELNLVGARAACHHLMVVLVVVGLELPIAAASPALVDRSAARCDIGICPQGHQLRAANLSCSGFDCTAEECCVLHLGCDAAMCSAEGPDYMPKVSLPTDCGNKSCTQAECCELSPFATSFETPQGAASSTAVLVAIVALAVCLGSVLAARRCYYRRKTDGGSLYLNQVLPEPSSVTHGWEGAGGLMAKATDLVDLSGENFDQAMDVLQRGESEEKAQLEKQRKFAEAERLITRCLAQLRKFVDPIVEEDCCNLLLGVIHAIQEAPEDPRFRRLDMSNDVLSTRVFGVQGIQEVLAVAGFVHNASENAFIIRANAPMQPLEAMKAALDTRIAELWEVNWATKAPSIFGPGGKSSSSIASAAAGTPPSPRSAQLPTIGEP